MSGGRPPAEAPAAGGTCAAAEPLLQVADLEVAIDDVRILRGVSFSVRSGEILGLVGPSGSGKTMTALAIPRLLPARARAAGEVRLCGRPLSGLDERQLESVRGRDVGMVFQEPLTALNPLMRIGDQVAEGIRLHRACSAAEARGQAAATLAAVGLGDVADVARRLPHELSGGQRQRAAIAIAVALAPPLLIADEPTTALDPLAQARILELLTGLARTRGTGLILVTHDLAAVAHIADRIALLHEGALVEQGAVHEMLRHMRHPYGRAMLAAARLAHESRAGPREDAAPLLEAEAIVQEYRLPRRSLLHPAPTLRALDGVSLRVAAGEIVGLVGESGSGKSSLLRIILALDRPLGGEVRLRGECFSRARGADLKRLRRSIQGVFQDPFGSFDPRWPVDRLVAEPLHLLDPRPGAAERHGRIAEALEQVGLPATAARRRPHQLSGGERQRVAIARALITRPALIALDEAVSALDVVIRAQLLGLLEELAVRLGLAYLLVSHDLNAVKSVADRVYVLRRGRIVEEGPARQVLAAPSDAYTKALIHAVPPPI